MSDSLSALVPFSQKINKTLEVFFEEQATLAHDIDHNLLHSLLELRNFSLRGGKSIRPFLAYLSYQMTHKKDIDDTDLFKILASIDLHHKHILILDDISDRDEERYGGPTIEHAYKKYFKGQIDRNHRARSFAMLDGVWLGALAKELLLQSKCPPEQLLAIIHIYDTTMYASTLAGWQIHGLQASEPLNQATSAEFIKGLELVTATYTFEGPLKIGLILGDDTSKITEMALTTYSKYVGTAFQIHDDILGLFGDSAKTGKPVGNDVREGKKTLLVQIAYQKATQKDKEFLVSVVGNIHLNQKDVARVQKIVTATGSLLHSKDLEQTMIKAGIKALQSLPDSLEKQTLIDLAHYVVTREK